MFTFLLMPRSCSCQAPSVDLWCLFLLRLVRFVFYTKNLKSCWPDCVLEIWRRSRPHTIRLNYSNIVCLYSLSSVQEWHSRYLRLCLILSPSSERNFALSSTSPASMSMEVQIAFPGCTVCPFKVCSYFVILSAIIWHTKIILFIPSILPRCFSCNQTRLRAVWPGRQDLPCFWRITGFGQFR